MGAWKSIHRGTQAILQRYQIPYTNDKGSQPISKDDLAYFDYIIGMDEQNVKDLKALSQGTYDDKISLFCDGGVPDPWYTGDFEETYRLVNDGCKQWLTLINNSRD